MLLTNCSRDRRLIRTQACRESNLPIRFSPSNLPTQSHNHFGSQKISITATERPGLREKISEITFSFIASRPSTTKFEGDVNGSSDVLFLSSRDEKNLERRAVFG